MSLINNPFHYYDDSGNIYYDKHEVALTGKSFKFFYKDNEFLKVNWQQKPEKTLKQLYLEQAKKLRDKFDYLILAYSGGHDSSNILETFYFNKIHLDEIFMFGAFNFDSTPYSDENHNAEIYRVCIPTIKNMNFSKTKISLVDYSLEMNNVIVPMMDQNWLKSGTMCQGPLSLWLTTLRNKFELKNKKVGIIFGVDKPSIKIYPNGSASTYFNDANILSYGTNSINYGSFNESEFTKIQFYWDSENSEILRRQCFEIYEFFTQKILCNETFTTLFKDIKDKDKIDLLNVFIEFAGHKWHRMVLRILYDLHYKINYISTGVEWGGNYNSVRGIGKSYNTGTTLGKVLSGHDAYLRRTRARTTELRNLYLKRLSEIHAWPWPDAMTLPTETREYFFIK